MPRTRVCGTLVVTPTVTLHWIADSLHSVAEIEPAESIDIAYRQEVIKYISHQYWDAVNDLIKELDLELVGGDEAIATYFA